MTAKTKVTVRRRKKKDAPVVEPYVMRRPIESHQQMVDEGIAWGEYHAGRGPKPVFAEGAPDDELEAAVLEPVEHPRTITDEDGEFYALRADLTFDSTPVTRILAEHYSLTADEFDGYTVSRKPQGFRRATLADVEEGIVDAHQQQDGWYLPVRDGEQADVAYWTVTA